MRTDYRPEPLTRSGLAPDPLDQFSLWFDEAVSREVIEPNAFSLATATREGAPSLRTVLLKYFDADGFVFFTNYESAKAREIEANAKVCMLFPWLSLQRQIVIKGVAAKVSRGDSLRYFLRRPRDSQLGAWISRQSEVISSRRLLEAKLAEVREKFARGDVSLPPFWGGYRIRPDSYEFWQGCPHRIHDRFLYRPSDEGWSIERLSP